MSDDNQNQRRLKILFGRVLASMNYHKNAPKIFFMHIPKCAGTSLSNALYATVPFQNRIGVIDANATRMLAGLLHSGELDPRICHEDLGNPNTCFLLREHSVLLHMCWGSALIHGHVLWSDLVFDQFGKDYKFVTMLRHPIERALSNFNMNSRNHIIENMSLDAFLESPLGFHHASTILRYFSGNSKVSFEEAPQVLKSAMSNARKFSLIGNVDNQDIFCKNFKVIFGRKLRLGRLNRALLKSETLSGQQYKKLENLCQFDLEIYHAFSNWKITDGV